MKKRYLITYTDRKIRTSVAENLLGIKSQSLNEGVSFLAENEISDYENALHFKTMGISSVGLTTEEAAILSKKDGILAVEEDFEMHILGSVSEESQKAYKTASSNLWNMDLINAPQTWANGITGSGINLAIIDTGIATHPDLVISGGVSFIPGVTSYNDGNGHGTHCAGIAAGRNGLNKVYGVAKNCNLYAVKVLADTGRGYTTWIISGMEWCVNNNINVASMSLGGVYAPTVAYSTAVKNCEDNGVTVVCATGNSYLKQTPSPPYPFPYVNAPANSFVAGDSNASPIAVGSVDINSVIAGSSSRGTNSANWNPVTLTAPGVGIYSTYLNNGYAYLSGTSMACPHVAGLAALLLQKYGTISPHLVMAKASSTCTKLGTTPYPNVTYGHGLINCLAATQ